MKFTCMKELPKRTKFKLRIRFEEFMAMNSKVAKVDLDSSDYSSPLVAYSTLGTAAKRHGFPIKVKRIDGEIYLVRTDM